MKRPAYIWTDNGFMPPPCFCPKCGYKAVRRGNDSNRAVYCMNPELVSPSGTPASLHGVCGWSATVFDGHVYSRHPSGNPHDPKG